MFCFFIKLISILVSETAKSFILLYINIRNYDNIK